MNCSTSSLTRKQTAVA